MTEKNDTQSHENYGVLVELKDSLLAISNRLEQIDAKQSAENTRIHARIDATQEKFINAISSLKDNTQTSIERLSTKGQISWAMIFTAITVLMVVIGGLAGVSNALVQARFRQLEIQDEAMKSVRNAQFETQTVRTGYLEKEAARNYDEILRLRK